MVELEEPLLPQFVSWDRPVWFLPQGSGFTAAGPGSFPSPPAQPGALCPQARLAPPSSSEAGPACAGGQQRVPQQGLCAARPP